jgi:hypothetical protein
MFVAMLASLGGLSVLPPQTVALGSSSQPAFLSTVPASRLAQLRRGINTSGWFAQVYDKRGYTREHFHLDYGRRHCTDQIDGLRSRAVER